jgi:hypothetical protein
MPMQWTQLTWMRIWELLGWLDLVMRVWEIFSCGREVWLSILLGQTKSVSAQKFWDPLEAQICWNSEYSYHLSKCFVRFKSDFIYTLTLLHTLWYTLADVLFTCYFSAKYGGPVAALTAKFTLRSFLWLQKRRTDIKSLIWSTSFLGKIFNGRHRK